MMARFIYCLIAPLTANPMNQFHVIGEKRVGPGLQQFYLHSNESGVVSVSVSEPPPMSRADADNLYHYARVFLPGFGLKVQACI